MISVQAHYDDHLGPVYAWMAGGIEAALERGAAEVAALTGGAPASGLAVDLGAGFGMHALPLARLGHEVLAVDACAVLLDQLHERRGDLPIETLHGDLRSYRAHLRDRPALVVCLGDTLTHLPDEAAVERLIADVAAELAPGGRLVMTFRDYTRALTGTQRFIPVRSDATRVFTCFLEYGDTRVTVHDLLYERDGAAWQLRVSAYPKLRLLPQQVADAMQRGGLAVEREAGPSGMIRLLGRRRMAAASTVVGRRP